MGVEFTAILTHHLAQKDVLQLPYLLDQCTCPRLADAIAALLGVLTPVYCAMDSSMSWQFTTATERHLHHSERIWSSSVTIDINGPAGFVLSFGPRTFSVWNVTRWGTFLSTPHVRTPLRGVCYELMLIFGGDQAIYVPDSGYHASLVGDLVAEGHPISAMETWLHQHVGEPAPSFTRLAEQHDNSYFVDTFTDFAQPIP